MARRTKAELLGVEDDIVQMHDKELMTHKNIASHLQKKGMNISDESVRRSYKSAKRKAEKYKVAAESAKAVLETVKDGTNTDLVEASNSILINMFYEKILDMEDLDFENPRDFFAAMSSLSKNQVELSKHRLNFQNGVEKAKEAVYTALMKELNNDEELLDKLQMIIASIEVKA